MKISVSSFLSSVYTGPKRHWRLKRSFVVLIPYFWGILFFLTPFLLVFKYSLSESLVAIPPLSPLCEWANELTLTIHLFFGNYWQLLADSLYVTVFLSSLLIAGIATVCCLILGYIMAYAIARSEPEWRTLLLLLVILPFATSFLIRVYAWIGLLSNFGVINNFLMYLGVIQKPLPLLYNSFSVCVAIVYCYLPFMILPIYATLVKIDLTYLEAAYDLGCRPWRALWSITIPLSMPGIIAGSVLVFIPAVGEFVIPELVGGPETTLIGRVLWTEFFYNRDWPTACAIAVTMLVVLITPVLWFQHAQLKKYEHT